MARAFFIGCWMLGVKCWMFGSAAAEPSLLTEARLARAESIPQVAIQKLRTLLKSADLPDDVRRLANYELAASLLAASELDEALWVVQPLAESGALEARLLQAQILTQSGRWSEALSLYQKLVAGRGSVEALLGQAECFQALDQPAKAAETLEEYLAGNPENVGAQLRLAGLFLDLEKVSAAQQILRRITPQTPADARWCKYVEGRILLAQNQPAPALVTFEELLQDLDNTSEGLLFGVTLGDMEARAMLHGYEAADRVLEKFISRYSGSRYLEEAFRRLDEVYEQEEHPSENELKKWALKPPAHRGALAQFYLARMYWRTHEPDLAAAALAAFAQTYADSPLLPKVHLMQADLFLEKNDQPAAVRALDAAMRHARSDEEKAQIELRTALVHYRQGEALLAENSFHRAAQGSRKLRQNAIFDAALAALNLRNDDRYYEDYRILSKEFPHSPLLSELDLEKGFTEARANDPSAAATIEQFLNHFPKHARRHEARIALAELALQAGDHGGAARYLKVVNASAPDAESAERAAYLAVFLADAAVPPAPDKVIARAQQFARDFPRSPFLPEVRMKLGQIYFGTGDHANAETQFTLLARESPESPYAETALFLAGQAAAKWLDPAAVDRALRFFDEVVKREGPLKLYARQQQAIVQGKLGKESEAVTIYDAILSAQPPPDAELRFAALCGKGDNLAPPGRKEPAQLEAAIAAYAALAALPDATPAWRNQALYKKGRVLELLNRQPEALTAYYDVLDKSAAEGREFFWYYKAGFDAAGLFEKQEDWKSAIGIYQKMAKIEGPRAAEARKRASDLRLSRFIWEQ